MTDFSLNKYHKRTFITGFEKDTTNNRLIIEYADGHSKTVKYSRKEEIRILEQMKSQVLDCYHNYLKVKNMLEEEKDSMNNFYTKAMLASILSSLVIFTGIQLLIFISTLPYFYALGFYIKACVNKKFCEKYIKDYERVLYFIRNLSDISNEDLKDEKTLEGVSKEAIKFIKSANLSDDVPVINLNTLEFFPTEDLKQIRQNINNGKALQIKPVHKNKNSVKDS